MRSSVCAIIKRHKHFSTSSTICNIPRVKVGQEAQIIADHMRSTGKVMFSLVFVCSGRRGELCPIQVLPGWGRGEGILTRGLIGGGKGRGRYPDQVTLLSSSGWSGPRGGHGGT